MTPSGTNRAAFTLIELLVVIAIIALLIGILLPSLGKAREAGRMLVCASRERQIGTVLDMYADTWEGNYPPRSSPRWTSLLTDEREMWEVYRCPSDREGAGGTPDNLEPDLVDRSYFMNGFNDFHLDRSHGVGGIGASNDRSMPRFAIDMPSETIVWAEKQSDSSHFYLDILEGDGNDFTELEPNRHGPRLSVYGFADGGARTMTYPEPLTPVNLFGVTRWGRESVQ